MNSSPVKEILKLKQILEKIAKGEAPKTTLDDLQRVYGYDPKGLAREALSILADMAEKEKTTLPTLKGASPWEFDSPCHHQSRHDLPPALRASIHEEAIAAFRDGKNDDANPYPKGCAAFLQWEHSYDEYKEACDAQDANDFA